MPQLVWVGDDPERIRRIAEYEQRILRVDVTPEMIDEARALARVLETEMRNSALRWSEGLSDRIRGSILDGEGDVAGFLGELTFLKLFPQARPANRDRPNFTHDILFSPMPGIEVEVEVKTKQRTVPCKLDFDASIADANPNQNPDFYAFMSAYYEKTPAGKRFRFVEMLGFITPERWSGESRPFKAGQVDPKSEFGWTIKADCHNLDYYRLDGPRFEEPLAHDDFRSIPKGGWKMVETG